MMRAFHLGITVLSLTLCSVLCSGQNCANGFNQQYFNCQSSSCSDGIYVSYPNGSQDGQQIQCGGEDCCGQLFTTCWGTGDCEPVKALNNPAVKERLARLSAESEVLVADCRGRYSLYMPSPAPGKNGASLALLNDHVLR
jgi:hypothetical protein